MSDRGRIADVTAGFRRVLGLVGAVRLLCLMLAAGTIGGCASGPRVNSLRSPADDGGAEAADPALAVDPDRGDVLLTWVAGDSTGWSLRFARSEDQGRTWTAPVTITPPGEHLHPHGEASPRVLAGAGRRVAVVWSASWKVPGREWPASSVRFARSLDGGRTWSGPLTLNDDSLGTPGSHSFHGAALAGGSKLVVAWLDERPPVVPAVSDSGADDAALYVARSSDFGGSWLPNEGSSGAVCPCCRVQLAGNDPGRVFAAWRHHAPGHIRDIVIGDLETEAVPAHVDGWRFDGCPHSGPAVFLDPDDTRHLVWYTGAAGRSGVYYARQEAGGTITAPVGLATGENLPVAHVALTVSEQLGPICAWDVTPDRRRAISVGRAAANETITNPVVEIPGSGDALYPQLAPLERGALVAWTEVQNGRRRVRVAAVDWRP